MPSTKLGPGAGRPSRPRCQQNPPWNQAQGRQSSARPLGLGHATTPQSRAPISPPRCRGKLAPGGFSRFLQSVDKSLLIFVRPLLAVERLSSTCVIPVELRGPNRPRDPHQSGGRINPQHLHEFRHLTQVSQRVPRGLIVAAQEIHIENVLPGPSAHRPGLDLAQADVPQGEHA